MWEKDAEKVKCKVLQDDCLSSYAIYTECWATTREYTYDVSHKDMYVKTSVAKLQLEIGALE